MRFRLDDEPRDGLATESVEFAGVFLVTGGLLGATLGTALGLRHFYRRKNLHSSDLATTIALVAAIVPMAVQIFANLDQATGKSSIEMIVGIAFIILMTSLFIGAALDRLNESLLKKITSNRVGTDQKV